MELHVSRAARERYGFDEKLFPATGRAVLPDFGAARRMAQRINERRAADVDPRGAVRAGDIGALGLIEEILHYVIDLYRAELNPRAAADALVTLDRRLGADVVDTTLATFVEHFPALAAVRGELTPERYLAAATDGRPNREIALEEALLLWLANMNPAYAPLGELFDDRPLEEGSGYDAAISGLQQFFADQPPFGPDDDDLISLLRRPALESPGSLADQLRWIRDNWPMVRARFGDRLLLGLDVLTEEERAEWMRFHGTHGGGEEGDTSALHGFEGLDNEYERFSQDRDWMPRLVLLAKSTYVWLDQLARQYGRPIWRLDQVPDEELDRLARAGFSGLWLIGLWERSHASQRIKQMRGNPEAVASAYSLMDYRIADDLGGEEAFGNLRDRAWARGIRLASDMVPNHMGIDSRWVVEHPDWFMSRPDPPYPGYSYTGPNLSSDERVGIHIEDHYFDNSDAAVTFKREDRWSGEARYVYHGNDGTSTPWNDTAQLDYLKPEVREALIQTILHVARLFPVIRFDAAMTLAKKHIARLWYPEPGSAGAIPSRAEYAMTRREFDRHMPHEFWREVVDRVAQEVPDTLLLAEAFWLMEGYFVRTLGMHRVYNSAFMNMLRDEKNAEYRLVVKNTLEFDPQILKRYVNFMNNPDERTAIDQFGDGDKYFGVCTLMATMPGLPMFGHGQLEGFTEKYGMEFRRANLAEEPKRWLVERHEREIFPLLHRRELFAEVADFTLYDFYTSDGAVNEDVFAYSNRRGGERALVVYHNRYAETAGWIRVAAVSGRPLAGALELGDDDRAFLVMRDMRSGLQYLRSVPALRDEGLHLSLAAYGCHVFVDMSEVHDTDGRYARLAASLGGRGVPDIEIQLRELELAPLHDALRAALASTEADARRALLAEVAALTGGSPPKKPRPVPAGAGAKAIARAYPETYRAWLAATTIEHYLASAGSDLAGGGWIGEWLADRVLPDADVAAAALALPPNSTGVLSDERVRRAIGVNDHDGVTWFNRERFEQLMIWLELQRGARASAARVKALHAAAKRAGYRLDRLASEFERPAAKGTAGR
jgi:glycosidase